MRPLTLLAVVLAAATLGGCALFASPSDGMAGPEEPGPSEGATPAPDRGLPICPGDPRCKKPG